MSFLSNIFKKASPALKPLVDLSGLSVDMHSHILPGIDDGAQTMEDSIAMILELKKLGIHKAITTPHVMVDSYRNTPEIILQKQAEVQAELKARNIEFQLEVSAEYYLDEGFDYYLATDQIIPLSGKYVLFETSYMSRPNSLERQVFDLKMKGFIPVLAHPERYTFMYDDFSKYQALRDFEILFQVNLGSYCGMYSPTAKKIAHFLAEKGWIDFLGTDAHNFRHIQMYKQALGEKDVIQLINSGKLLNNLLLK